MDIFAVTVNFQSSHVVEEWVDSIRRFKSDAFFFVVDNYSSDDERRKIEEICKLKNIRLIHNDNTGYGSGLNLGLSVAVAAAKAYGLMQGSVFLFGNPDVKFIRLPDLENECCAYMPSVIESKRDRNPFMTELQRRLVFIYWPAARLNSPLLFLVAASIIRIIGFLPSRPYAMHGSQFCLSGSAISITGYKIFNESSFLYWEEMEFAETLRRNGIQIKASQIVCHHSRHVSTHAIVKDRKKINEFWKRSWLNWIERKK